MSTEITPREKQEVQGAEGTRPGRSYVPDIDVSESGDSLCLWADMAGVDENSVEVDLKDGVLSIVGRVSVKNYEGLQPAYTEYNVGDYVRRLRVADDVDVENIKAKMRNGVLELQLPKAQRLKARRIQVQAG
ncbi:MAG TPA: Hsp20/alpha crystallin family protein [Candidatus Acidoferrales bacterium]|nr:Hsp20/alpha crystallin family protein [Candidatus Acidoferrales bacterium]